MRADTEMLPGRDDLSDPTNYRLAYEQLSEDFQRIAAQVRAAAGIAFRYESQVLLAGGVLATLRLVEEVEDRQEPRIDTAQDVFNFLSALNAEAAKGYAAMNGPTNPRIETGD